MARTVAGAAPGRTNRRFLILAVACAALSGGLLYAWMASNGGDSEGGGSTAAGSQQIVVARQAIKQRTSITSEMLEIKSLPANAVVVGSFGSIEDVVGKVTKLPVEANEQVVASSVVDTERPLAEALSFVVPSGKRAMSVIASQVITAGGLVLPGDYVDIIWSCCKDNPVVAKTIVKNVQVAAVAQTIVSSGPVTGDASGLSDDPVAADTADSTPEAITVTLLLTPLEAQQMHLAEGIGRLRLDLRGINDSDVPQTAEYTLLTELLPIEALASLPDDLKPDGYKPAGR